MAVRTPTNEKIPGGVLITWTGLLNTDTGAPVAIPTLVEKSVQLSGTLGVGGNARIEGSNHTSTPVWGTLKDADGADLNLNAIGMFRMVRETPYQIRPIITAGDGSTNLTVKLLLTRIR
jgi:hypothetical protein